MEAQGKVQGQESKVEVIANPPQEKPFVMAPEKDNKEYAHKLIISLKNKMMLFYFQASGILQSCEDSRLAEIKKGINEQHKRMIQSSLLMIKSSEPEYNYLIEKYKGEEGIKNCLAESEQVLQELMACKFPSIFVKHLGPMEFLKLYKIYLYCCWFQYKSELNKAVKDKTSSNERNLIKQLTEDERAQFLDRLESQDIPSAVFSYLKISNPDPKINDSLSIIYSTSYYMLRFDMINKNSLVYLSEINKMMYILIQLNCKFDELERNPLTMSEGEIENNLNKLINKAHIISSQLNERLSSQMAEAEMMQKDPKQERPQIQEIDPKMAEMGHNLTYKILLHLKESLFETCYNYIKNLKNPTGSEFDLEKESNVQSAIIFTMYSINENEFSLLCSANIKDPAIETLIKEINLTKQEIREKKFPSILKKYIDLNVFRKLYPMYLYVIWYYQYKEMQSILQSGDLMDLQNKFIKALLKVSEMNLSYHICKDFGIIFNGAKPEDVDIFLYSTLYYALTCEPKYAAQLHFLSEMDSTISESLLAGEKFEELEGDITKMTHEQKQNNLKSIIKKRSTFINCLGNYLNPQIKIVTTQKEEEKISEDIQKRDAKFVVNLLSSIKFYLITFYYEIVKVYGAALEGMVTVNTKEIDKEYEKAIETLVSRLGINYTEYKYLLDKFQTNVDVQAFKKEFETYQNELKSKKPISIFFKHFDPSMLTKLYPQYMYERWHIFYSSFQDVLKGKKPEGESIKVSQEEIFQVVFKLNSANTSQKVFEHSKLPLVECPTCNFDFYMQSTFYYALINDPVITNQLQFLSEINTIIMNLIEEGQIIPILLDDPLKLPEDQYEKKLNQLLQMGSALLARYQEIYRNNMAKMAQDEAKKEESKK